MSFGNLNADVLMEIFTKIDKYEHMRLLINSFTQAETLQLKEIIKEANNKIASFRSVSFNDFKEQYNTLMRLNKKDNCKKVICFNMDVRGKNKTLYLNKLGLKYIYAKEEGDTPTSIVSWKLLTAETITDYKIIDITECPQIIQKRIDQKW